MNAPTHSPTIDPTATPAPARWRRLIGYLVLIYLAILGAEYVSSGTPIPPLNPYNFLAYPPYDWLLVLIAARWAPLSFRTYYIFGALMGLAVETSITNVAWGHGEGYNYFFPIVGGFGTWELFFMVLTYHPIFSIAIPFLLCSHYLGLPRPVPLGTRLRRVLLFGLPLYMGASWAMASKPAEIAIMATVVNLATVTLLIAVYRRWGAMPAVPTRRSWIVPILIIAVIWVLGLFRWVPEPPTLIGTLVGIGLLGWMARRSAQLDTATRALPEFEPAFRWRGYLGYVVYFAAAFAIPLVALTAAGEGRYVLVYPLSVFPAVIGTLYLLYSAVRLLSRRIPRAPTPTPVAQPSGS
jgi:hypothetical protein